MDLSKYKRLGETDSHWEVEGPRGSFRIAKTGISKKLRDQIAQHFADGGEVAMSAAEPSPVPASAYDPANAATWGTPVTWDMLTTPPNPEAAARAAATASPEALAAGLARAGIVPPPGAPLAPADPVNDAMRVGLARAGLAAPPGAQAPAPVAPALSPAHVPGAMPPPGPQAPEMLAAHVSGAPDITQSASVTGSAPAPAPTAPAGAGSGTQKAIDQSFRESDSATRAAADVAQQEADSIVAAQVENEQKRQALAADWTTKMAAWQQRGDALRDAVLNQTINPNQYWQQRGTGGKISAAIGIILGGLGSGLTGGPNVAMKVIGDAVDRDIDAQKANLDNKRSMLAYHVQEGHSLEAAHQLARADALDAAAAQLQLTSSKYAGQKAQNNASLVIADLHKSAALTRQAVAGQNLDLQLKGLQVEGARQQMAFQRLQAQLMMQAAQRDPMAAMSKEDRERSVMAPDGKLYMLARKEDAAKAQEQVQGFRTVMSALSDMRAQRKQYGRAWLPFTAEGAAGENMRQQMVGGLRLAVLGPGVIDKRERAILEKLVPEPGEIFTTDAAFEARMREIEQKAYDGMWSGLANSGVAPPRARIPERKE